MDLHRIQFILFESERVAQLARFDFWLAQKDMQIYEGGPVAENKQNYLAETILLQQNLIGLTYEQTILKQHNLLHKYMKRIAQDSTKFDSL
ncbi:hypothetical protein RIF29_39121 [Crotalaria pallida]|uniref:Uncharacterized protein n=1 Tax=Crotalaria pallida TaxID=3830 RepID=A0AAN9E2C3_CROPI